MRFLSFLRTPRLSDADEQLREELAGFSHDGLVQLEADLESGSVLRGTWDGCVLSYRRGGPGSAASDGSGRRGNAFTRFWDAEVYPEARLLELVRAELQRRQRNVGREAERAGRDGSRAST